MRPKHVRKWQSFIANMHTLSARFSGPQVWGAREVAPALSGDVLRSTNAGAEEVTPAPAGSGLLCIGTGRGKAVGGIRA